MAFIDLNPDLLRLVEGRRVAIVGPAPYLLDKSIGADLNKYDVVCRINDIIPRADLQEHYGERTDIMFHNCGTAFMPGLKRKIEKSPEAFKNLKMVVCAAIKAKHTDTDYLQWQDNHVSDVVANFQKLNIHQIPFYWIGVKDYKNLYSRVGAEINSGIAAISVLLQYPIKELFVTGFTFYLGGTLETDLYYPGHWDTIEASTKTDFGINSGHGLHANMHQIRYFKEMAKNEGDVLAVDSHINQLLQLEHKNVVEI